VTVGRKRDLKEVDWIAQEQGIPPALRDEFGDYLHECKESGAFGSGPNGDFTREELREKAREFKEFKGI